MSKVSRSVLISELDALTNGTLSTMLRNGHKIEIYHVTMDGMTNIDIPTINGIVNGQIHYSPRDIESQNLMVYKNSGDGRVPLACSKF